VERPVRVESVTSRGELLEVHSGNRIWLARTLIDATGTWTRPFVARNVHLKYVKELLGHASIALTLDTYSRVLPGMDGAAASAMDEALG
jgi:integrase